MISNFNHQPHHEAVNPNERSSEQTNLLKFYKAFGNISEFGLYFSGSLGLALLSRLIPGMLIAYALLIACGAAYLWLTRTTREQESAVIGLALAAALVAGFWDAIASFMSLVSPLVWLSLPLFALGLFGMMRMTGQ